MRKLQELWRYRSYIQGSVSRDFSLRYKGSVLGVMLVFFVPAFQIGLYVLVFGSLLKGRLPGTPTIYGYSIYLCSGILLWNFFTELLQRSQLLYLENANLIKKTAFPRGALSVINAISSSINLFLAFAIFLIFLSFSGFRPGGSVFGLILVWLVLGVMALSIGLCIAVLQVFFRDFAALTGIGLQALFWVTPIVYPVEILPGWLVPWVALNPLLAPVATAQALLLGTPLPDPKVWISSFLVCVVATLLAVRLHRQHQAELMDNL